MLKMFIYPIKSLLPVEVSTAEITSEGLRFDRQYVLIKTPNEDAPSIVEHLTIKTTFGLCLFQPTIDASWSKITIKHTQAQPSSSVTIPLSPSPLSTTGSQTYRVSIFGTTALGVDMGEHVSDFFSQHLKKSVRLLFIAGNGRREIPGAAYSASSSTPLTMSANSQHIPQRIRFADAAPLLITSSASEQDAKERLPRTSRDEDVIIRFRPNIHIGVGSTLPPYDEDCWSSLKIHSGPQGTQPAIVRCIFKTPRCLSLNADMEMGGMVATNRQLYGLLARDRRVNSAFPHKPVFGQYACAAPIGTVLRVGDVVEIIERTSPMTE